MARPAKNDFTESEARRFRDGIRDLCDWLGIAVSDLRLDAGVAGHGERPVAWPYNALKHGHRALTRETAVTLWLRLNARANEKAWRLRDGAARKRFQREWERERGKCVPLALTQKLAGPIVPIPATIRALDDAFRERNAGKVALRLSALMSPNSEARRFKIHSQLRAWFETLYEPAAKRYLEQHFTPPDATDPARPWINPSKLPVSNKTHCRKCGCKKDLHALDGTCTLCRQMVRRRDYCL